MALLWMKVLASLLLLQQISDPTVCAQESQQEMELSDLACKLDSNETLRLQFYKSVRKSYGDNGDPNDSDMYSQIRQGVASNIRCYGSCKGATVHTTTWCVHVYSTGEPVKVCLNSSGIVSETSAAVLLGLKNVLRIASCGNTAGCLSVVAPYYLNNAYFTCASRTPTCTRRSFIELTVEVPKEDVTILDFPAPARQMVKTGEGLILRCEATAGYQFAYLQWIRRRDNFTFVPIYEDPFCIATITNCSRDNTPGSMDARQQSVRMYNLFRVVGECEEVAVNMTSYLVFDNVTAQDGGDYSCVALNYLTAGLTVSQSLQLITVSSAYGSFDNALEVVAHTVMVDDISSWCPPCQTTSVVPVIFVLAMTIILIF